MPWLNLIRHGFLEKRWLVIQLVALAAFMVACSDKVPPKPAVSERPQVRNLDVILISLDTLRADRLGIYGEEANTSPNIDRLAQQGLVFDRAYTHAPWTAPAHEALFRSKVPTTFRLDDGWLVEVLRNHGVKTSAFVGGGFISREFGFHRGFETFTEFDRGRFAEVFPAFTQWYTRNRLENRPSFIFLHTYDLHTPYKVPSDVLESFSSDPKNAPLGKESSVLLLRAQKRGHLKNSEENLALEDFDLQAFSDVYRACLANADRYIGQLINLLDQQGTLDRTVIILTSDHGEEFWEHQSLGHGHTLYEELLRVPLIIRLPRNNFQGRRINTPVRLMDVAPTILDLFSIQDPDSFQGTSLLDTLDDPGKPLLVEARLERTHGSVMLYPWKVIYDRVNDSFLFYNLEEDPLEKQPVTDPALIPEHLRTVVTRPLHTEVDTIESLSESASSELKEQLRALGYLD